MDGMKDSGVRWIGEIPESWELTKIRYVTALRSESGLMNVGDKYIGLENISNFTGQWIESDSSYDDGNYDIYKKGDLLFSKLRPYLGKAIIATDNGFCTGELSVIKSYDGDMRYLFYYLLSDGTLKTIDSSTYGSKMPRASWDFIKNLSIPQIKHQEQTAIADFLDTRCAQLDSIIADIEKQIETLKAYRKSLIFEAVTKGLNKSVKMKNSGFSGIGQIPENWEISKIKYIIDETHPYPVGDGDHGMIKADDYLTEGIPYIRVLNLTYGFGLKMDNVVYISEAMNAMLCNSILRPRDILIAKTGATIGKTAIVPDSLPVSNTTSHVGKITLPKTQCAKYFYYVATSSVVQKQIEDISAMQSTRPELGIEGLKNLTVVVPPLVEQKAIADFLDRICCETDDIISTKEKQLVSMQNHKKSLIFEYVTGKKRVKEVQ